MKEIRLSLWSDVERLKVIWKLCFGDSDSFIELYYSQRYKPEQVAVYLQDGVIAAMLTMIPVQLIENDKEEKCSKGSMLYAIATHPEYQHRGIATELMNWTAGYLRDQEIELCVLVPAEAHLFDFYVRQGYQVGFTLQEVVLSKEELNALLEILEEEEEPKCGREAKPDFCQVLAATPQEYNRIRSQLLRGTTYIIYEEEEIAYQKKISRLSGADIYEISACGVQGCAAIERLSEERVLIKEFLFPEQFFSQGLKALGQSIEARELIIRTPARCGKVLGGSSKPFGMIKKTTSSKTGQVEQDVGSLLTSAYLGLAFD